MIVPDGGWVEYSSNNSGGYWWLTDEDWRKLEAAGWEVDWYGESTSNFVVRSLTSEGRFLGALASSARRQALSLEMAIAEWQYITGQDPADEGCNCCGSPHSFYVYDSSGGMVW